MKTFFVSGIFSLLSAIPAFAGTWQQDGPVWTYTKDDGTKATSEWIQDKEKWYHFGCDSIMQTGWIKCDDKFYYLDSFGAMYENRWVLTGYYVGADGAWIPGYVPKNTTKVITDHSSDDDDDDHDDDDDRRSYSSIDSTNSKHQESTDYSDGSSSTGSSSELTPGQTGGPKHQESTNYSEGSSASSSSSNELLVGPGPSTSSSSSDTGYTNELPSYERPSNESNSNSGLPHLEAPKS